MNFSRISVDRPVTTVMAIMIVVLVGLLALTGIPMDLLPDFSLPVAIAYVQYPNAAPQEVESMVTVPLEQALSSVSGLDSISSMTTEGVSIVMVSFAMDTDMDFATLDMREKIAMVEAFLPEDASDPMVMKMSMDFTPVIQIYISSDQMDLADLNRRVEDNILSAFERSEGVASVSAYGGIVEEISIVFNQERLTGYGLSLATVSQLLAAENINLPSGEVSRGATKMVVRTIGEFQSIDDIRSLPLTLADGSIVRLQDIASVEESQQEQTSISRVDGIPAVGISISKQSTANTVEVSNEVRKTMADLQEAYPELIFTVGMDQADYIKNSVASVGENALVGALLAIFVIFLFLRSVTSTLVVAIAIPTAFLATFSLMDLTGMTLNMITLCALTLAVGMLVDNSIVVTENIYRISKDENLGAYDASLRGSKQVFLAISASTLTSMVVYLPIALSDGIASLLFKDFCWTIIIALLASWVVALTAVPMLSSKLLNTSASTDHLRLGNHRYNYRLLPRFSRFIAYLIRAYEGAIRRALKHRKRVIVTCILIFVLSCGLIALVGMEFFPASDEGIFAVYVDTPYGTSLEEKDAIITQIEAAALAIPELEHCTVDIGLTSSYLGTESASVSVILTPKEERSRSITEILDELKATI
ncbi:MAG: efflux RND transporter permease subunit, partial [Bacillota bacterium]|nr:efflux RND transporter permease subunit [Bacillota bacterium]